MNRKNILSEKMLTSLVIINLIAFINFFLFNIYNNLFFYINLMSIFIIILIQDKFYKKDIETIIFLLFFLAYGFFSLFITNGGVGSVISAFYSMLVYFSIKKIHIRDKSIKIIMIFMIVLNVFLFISSPGYYIKWYFNREKYINSNTIGMVIMYTAVYSNVFLKKVKIKNSKLYSTFIYIISILGILNVQSRGSLLTLVSFLIFDILIPKRLWKKKCFSEFAYITILLVGLIIPYLYTQLYNSGLHFNIPFTQKSLYTGREIIWSNFYHEMDNNILAIFFGLGSNADLWSGNALNLHNNYLGIIANFGVIGFILYYGFWFVQIQSLFKKQKMQNYEVSLLMVFFSVLVSGFFEISTLWHTMFFFNFMSLGLVVEGKY